MLDPSLLQPSEQPWKGFQKGATKLETRRQRRQFVFERCQPFPPLHHASMCGDRAHVRTLLTTAGVCVFERDACGRIALHHAVITGHLKIVKRFLRRRDGRLQIHVRDNSDRTPLHYVLEKIEALARHYQGSKSRVEVAMTLRVQNQRGHRLWKLADRMLQQFSRQGLEERGKGEGARIKDLDLRCRGDVWDCCRFGDLERLEMIWKVYGCCKADWHLEEVKRTLLHEACENQQLQVVGFLLSTIGVPLLAQDTSGSTALHCAARRGHVGTCQLLLGTSFVEDHDCRVNDNLEDLVLLQDGCGRTCLHWSLLCSSQLIERHRIALLFAQSYPAVLHICDHDGVSPLHLAIQRNDSELVQRFIDLGANIWGSAAHSVQYRGMYKAAWAPCGLVFQCRKHQNVVKDSTREAIDTGCTKLQKKGLDWDTVQHPSEALWYWAQRSNERKDLLLKKTRSSERGRCRDWEPLDMEEKWGCRKYGGVCPQCQRFLPINSCKEEATQSIKDNIASLSPLLLALRLCALEWKSESTFFNRVAIVKLLLLNGASPEHVWDIVPHTNEYAPSALGESLRFSLRWPEIIPLLRHHGARQLDAPTLLQWCLATPLSMANEVEVVLLQLSEVEKVASSSTFVTLLFLQKQFAVLCKLWSKHAQLSTCKSMEEQRTGDDRAWRQGTSLWKCIQDTFMAWKIAMKRHDLEAKLGTQHLDFLCELVRPGCKWLDDKNQVGHDRCVWELLEFCVDAILPQSVQDSERDGTMYTVHNERVWLSMKELLDYWKCSEDFDDAWIQSKALSWITWLLRRGSFDEAIVVLERCHTIERLLDKVFAFYSLSYHFQENILTEQARLGRKFLTACAMQLLTSNSIPTDEKHLQGLHYRKVASVRSVVYICAFNLGIDLATLCFDRVYHAEESSDRWKLFAAMRTIRVGGKTMVQWIHVHDRCDVMLWLLKRLLPGIERGVWWKDFVAASIHGSNQSLGDGLFSIYLEAVYPHLEENERSDLLRDLIVQNAIPSDAVGLMERLLTLWADCDSNWNKCKFFENVLLNTGFFNRIARWNAMRIANFCLSDQCLTDVSWHHILSEDKERWCADNKCTPLELCRLLGHYNLYKLLASRFSLLKGETGKRCDAVETINSTSMEFIAKDRKKVSTFGLLRNIVEINEKYWQNHENVAKSSYVRSQRCTQSRNLWLSAVAHNQVSHLQALSLVHYRPSISMRTVLLSAIKAASMDALTWILKAYAPIMTHLSDTESSECLYTAAKHPGSVYTKMTLLLLENHFSPGRLSGDGVEVPLLHRAACFTNVALARQIMAMLLERSDCDVNALDAFGNTAVSYAIAAGCIHNACFLIQHSTCRLEAEYEGQACFYYTLHLVPSFAWRTLIRHVLVTKRARAFLHCDANDKSCSCKSYEPVKESSDGNAAFPQLCGFCGHEATTHDMMPLPSWFRDQYDTYNAVVVPQRRSSSRSDDFDGEVCNLDDEKDFAGVEDEETQLENCRGRLNVEALKRILAIRYHDILHASGLRITANNEHEEDVQTNEEFATRHGDSGIVQWNAPMKNIVEESTIKEYLLEDSSIGAKDWQQHGDGLNDNSEPKLTGPWWLQQELARVHPLHCLCQTAAFVTNPTQLLYVTICRWLRRMAIDPRMQPGTDSNAASVTKRDKVASIQAAFEQWRDAQPSGSQSVATSSAKLLNSILFYWRYRKLYVGFLRWKKYQTSAEFAHFRLVTRLEDISTKMRQNRLMNLQLRQQQLQEVFVCRLTRQPYATS